MLKYYVIEFYHKSKEYITDYYIQNQYWHIASNEQFTNFVCSMHVNKIHFYNEWYITYVNIRIRPIKKPHWFSLCFAVQKLISWSDRISNSAFIQRHEKVCDRINNFFTLSYSNWAVATLFSK